MRDISARILSLYQAIHRIKMHLYIAPPFRTSGKELPPSLDTKGISGYTMSTVDHFWLIHARNGANRGVVAGSRTIPRPRPSHVVAPIRISHDRLGRPLGWRVVTRACSFPRLFAQLYGLIGRVQRNVSVQRGRAWLYCLIKAHEQNACPGDATCFITFIFQNLP